MTKHLLFVIILFLLCYRCSCEDYNNIEICNNSNQTIYFTQGINYPDTTLENNPNYIDSKGNRTYIAGSSYNRIFPFKTNFTTFHPYKSEFRYLYDTLMVFLFDGYIIDHTIPEIIEKNYLVLQRYDLSLSDLEKLNWKIYYPPTEAMKDMKMWPPYKKEGYDD
ncbi:MAG: hypothetical protein FWG85_06475 [Bacteroidetes bacterium]|nr:hypothetical protein [Bacteroidota bacterium]